MNNRVRRLFRPVSFLLIASLFVTTVSAQGKKQKPSQQQKDDALKIQGRTNGIYIGSPKVYDDSSLRLMLNNARARLAAIQSIDQTGLMSRIGAVTGASLDQSSFAVSVTGPPIPGSAVTSNAPTGNTVVNSAGGGSTVTTTNLPVQGTVTNNPQQNPTVPTAPSGGLTLPTNSSVSALDALAEQMQLTYEIANLQLLLEGSLSDRFVKNTRLVKPRTTLGFPITISAPYKNAVAVVEVQVTNADQVLEPDKPAVTALLPREKTYNVAALTDKMTSIGGGVVTQFINGGFSLLRGHKSYYIVQDQDTLANLIPPDPVESNATAFSWEFRPVLGQPYVKAGMKQTFVQLSAPLEAAANCFGRIQVRTYWRRIDRKTGVLKDVIPESIVPVMYIEPEIPIFDLTPVVQDVDYDDLGNGQIRVNVEGNFLNGTYIRVGNSSYRDGSPGFVSELTRIQFVASAADVAKYKAYIVSRDGSETEVTHLYGGQAPPQRVNTCSSFPPTAQGFEIKVPFRDVLVPAGARITIPVTITSAIGVNPTVTLTATGYPAPTGPRTAWSVPAVNPAGGTSLRSSFTLDTLAATPLSTYTVQLQASAPNFKTQSINMNVTVAAPFTKPTITTLTATSFDDTKSIVSAVMSNEPSGPKEYYLVINDRVFGLMDAPIERNSTALTYRAIVPTSLISGPTTVKMAPLFWAESYETLPKNLVPNLESTADKVVILDQSGDPISFLLYGSRLSPYVIQVPTGITLKPVGKNPLANIGVFTIPKAQWGSVKQIMLQKALDERPVFVAIPQPEPPPKITLTAGGRVVVGTNDVVVTGDSFDDLKSVTFNKIPIKKVIDGKSVKLTGLVAAGVTSIAGEPELQFEFEGGKKNSLKLEVVNGKVEIIQKQ